MFLPSSYSYRFPVFLKVIVLLQTLSHGLIFPPPTSYPEEVRHIQICYLSYGKFHQELIIYLISVYANRRLNIIIIVLVKTAPIH